LAIGKSCDTQPFANKRRDTQWLEYFADFGLKWSINGMHGMYFTAGTY
jgi:hypothetical protein